MILFGPTVLTVKVTLRDVKPAVWRRIVLRADTPLPKFARILEAAMGWQGHHLHMFDAGGVLFGEDDEDTEHLIDERHAMVHHLLPDVRAKLVWSYDFGDGWEHDVVLESIDVPEERTRYPLCLEGKRACPPEDCGGPYGYEQLLLAIADPNNPEHSSAVSWMPAEFDPKVFDIASANRRMRGR